MIMYTKEDMEKDKSHVRLSHLAPGTEIEEYVYMKMKSSVRPMPLPFYLRAHALQGISEGFLFGRPWCSRPDGTMYLAFGMTRHRGKHYFFLGLSTISGKENKKYDFRFRRS